MGSLCTCLWIIYVWTFNLLEGNFNEIDEEFLSEHLDNEIEREPDDEQSVFLQNIFQAIVTTKPYKESRKKSLLVIKRYN